MQKFISCDWGSSALRLGVFDIDKKIVLVEVKSDDGIAPTFELWKKSGRGEEDRFLFYRSILNGSMKNLEKQLGSSLEDMPLIISGMASSSIGMLELPYKEIPFSTDGHDLYIKIIEATAEFKHTILLISGVRTVDDVMRGEETQLIGCLNDDDNADRLFIFPGTHSKHVRIKDGKVEDIKTYMTGEFFELLSKKSILSNDVEEGKGLEGDNNIQSFEKAVADSLDSNLLHNAFLVRTNDLLHKLSKEENYYYLSGLLIGTELKELIGTCIPLTIVSNEWLIKLYSVALRKLGILEFECRDAGKAVVEAHCKIYNLYKSKFNGDPSFVKQ